jgi:hypothetical protein
MHDLVLNDSDKFNFMPPCLYSLNEYNGPLYNKKHNLPHPSALINTSWIKFTDSVKRFLDKFENNINVNALELHDVAHEYENVIYQATEHIENMRSNLKKCLLPESEYSKWKPDIIKRWSDYPTAICNKIKHNNNFLITVEVVYQYGSVRGYSLCHHINEAVKPNKDFHSNQEAFAYGSDLRRMLAHIYLISNAINLEIEKITLNIPKVVGQTPFVAPENHKDFLFRVSKFMPLAFHDQKIKDTAKFSFDGKTLSISYSNGFLVPTGKGLSTKSFFNGDGHTKSFHIFYSNKS